MNDIFFSIVIPTLNSERTIHNCLNSILHQSYCNYEILIIDGLSTDKTLDIIKQYSLIDSKIKFFSKKDNGIYDAMNKGIKISVGRWVNFMGSDDQFSTSSVLQEIFDLNKNDYQVVYGNAKIIGNTSWANDGDLYDGEFNLQKLLKRNICHQAIFYNRICFHNNPLFNRDYGLCADWDFNLRCWAKKSFLYVSLTIVDFYGGGQSTQNNSDPSFTKAFTHNIINYFGYEQLKNIGMFPFQNNASNSKLRVFKNWIIKLNSKFKDREK